MKKPRMYVFNATRTANQDLEENIRIDQSANFTVTKILFNSTGTFQLRMRDSANNQFLMDSLVNSECLSDDLSVITGKYRGAIKLDDAPMKLTGQTIVYFQVKDISSAPNTVQIVLFGYEEVSGQ
jgi:hypothetical protein